MTRAQQASSRKATLPLAEKGVLLPIRLTPSAVSSALWRSVLPLCDVEQTLVCKSQKVSWMSYPGRGFNWFGKPTSLSTTCFGPFDTAPVAQPRVIQDELELAPLAGSPNSGL
ncbi:MAG: hypothetical protein Q9224_001816 [Gallowayella concinna]